MAGGKIAPSNAILKRPFIAPGMGAIQNPIPPALFVGTANQTAASATMAVTAITQGQLVVGSVINGPGVAAGTTVTAIPAGGGIGNYTVNNTTGFTSALITAIGPGGPTVAISTTNPLAAGLQFSPFLNSQPPFMGALGPGSIDLSFCSVMRGGNPVIAGTASPDFNLIKFETVSAVAGGGSYLGGNSIQIGVMFSGLTIVMVVKGLSTNITAKVNDQYVSLTPTVVPTNASLNFYSLTFPTAQLRRIDFIGDNVLSAFKFGGFWVSATDTLYPAPIRGGLRMMIMGDSFTTSTGAGSTALGFPGVVGEYLGIDDVWQSGIGGTGLINPGNYCTYQQRVLTDVIPFAPDELIIQGFFNDNNFLSGQIQAALTLLISTVQNNLPLCRITVVGPYVNSGSGTHPGDPGFMGTRNACAATVASFASNQVRYMDPTTGPAPLLPHTTQLSAAVSAGATTFLTTNINFPVPGTTYQLPDGKRLFAISRSGFTTTVDRIPGSYPAGTQLTQVGNCYLRGAGFQGATTGIGNADNLVFTDDVHPSSPGHIAMGVMIAGMIANSWNS